MACLVGADIPVSSLGSPYVERLVTKKINDVGSNHMNQTDTKKKKRVTAPLDSSATNGEVKHVVIFKEY